MSNINSNTALVFLASDSRLNVTAETRDMDDFEFLQKLDAALCYIVVALGIPTFALAVPSYWRLLHHPYFAKADIFYIITIEGVVSMLAFISTMLTVELTTWPAFSSVYVFLNRFSLAVAANALTLYLQGVHLQAFCSIALNRFASIAFPLEMRMFSKLLFRLSLLTIFALPVLSTLQGFLDFQYVPFSTDNNETYFLPVDSGTFNALAIAPQMYTWTVVVVTFLLNLIVAFLHYRFRKENNLEKRAERGLAITSIASFTVYCVYGLVRLYNQYGPPSFLRQVGMFMTPHLYFLSTIMPFWFLVAFSSSVRVVLAPQLFGRHSCASPLAMNSVSSSKAYCTAAPQHQNPRPATHQHGPYKQMELAARAKSPIQTESLKLFSISGGLPLKGSTK